jgi:hypothetical protein
VWEPDAQESPELNGLSTNDFEQALSNLSNAELLAALDLPLLELEKCLYRYVHVGPELLEMDDEGLVLAVRVKARLGQALSSAQHPEVICSW